MMERHVKERLIGASVLVALIVLIVPEMLSGPRQPSPSAAPLTVGLPASNRTVSVDLTTSTATAEPDAAPGASAPAPPPAGDGASEAASDSAAASGAATGDGASEGGPPEHAAPSSPTVTTLQAQQPNAGAGGGPSAAPSGSTLETPPSGPKSTVSGAGTQGHRGWAVQLGSFASRANAERLIHQLQARGGSSLYVSASGSGSSLRYRVRMGPLPDRGAAERAADRLRAGGHPSTVVAPNS